MRLFRRARHYPARRPQRRESAEALAASQEKLQREREHLVLPMRQMIEQNNVTDLIRELIRRKGEAHGRGASAG